MPKATRTPTTVAAVARPSRRQLLGGAAAALGTSLAVTAAVLSPDPVWGNPPESSDAHLLALCDHFHAHQNAAEATDEDDDEGLAAGQARAWEVQQLIRPIHPATQAGQAAKAHVALRLMQSVEGPAMPGSGLDLTLATLAEVAGVPYATERPMPEVAAGTLTSSPDAELLAACAAADAIQRRQDALYRGATRVEDDKERDALLAPLYDEQEPFLEQVVDLRAQTLAGHVARARTLLLWDKDPPSADDSYYMNERLIGALLRDLGGEALT